jgi:RNA polymerase sigma-70 factor (ECF subfamily)
MIYAEGCGLSLSQAEEAAPLITVESLVPAYTPLLFRMAHALLRNRAEADDVVQDTFLRVLQHRRSLPEIRDMRVWLVRIAWNLALDRRRKVRPDQMDDAFARSPVWDLRIPSSGRRCWKVSRPLWKEGRCLSENSTLWAARAICRWTR